MPEGKKAVKETTWNDLRVPLLSRATTLFESAFETDVAGVRGVRRLVELEGSGEQDGVLLTDTGKMSRDASIKYGQAVSPLRSVRQRFLVIAYQDPATSKWYVLDITEETDTDKSVAEGQNYLTPDKYSLMGVQPSMKRFQFASSLLRAGKLAGAYQEFRASAEMAKTEVAPDFMKVKTTSAAHAMAVIEKVVGPRQADLLRNLAPLAPEKLVRNLAEIRSYCVWSEASDTTALTISWLQSNKYEAAPCDKSKTGSFDAEFWVMSLNGPIEISVWPRGAHGSPSIYRNMEASLEVALKEFARAVKKARR